MTDNELKAAATTALRIIAQAQHEDRVLTPQELVAVEGPLKEVATRRGIVVMMKLSGPRRR
jgi:hypothetical protein